MEKKELSSIEKVVVARGLLDNALNELIEDFSDDDNEDDAITELDNMADEKLQTELGPPPAPPPPPGREEDEDDIDEDEPNIMPSKKNGSNKKAK